MKTLKQILQLDEYQEPGTPGNKAFFAANKVTKTDYPAGSPEADDKLFNATNVGKAGFRRQTNPKDKVLGEAMITEDAYQETIKQILMLKQQMRQGIGDKGNLGRQLEALRIQRNRLAATRSSEEKRKGVSEGTAVLEAFADGDVIEFEKIKVLIEETADRWAGTRAARDYSDATEMMMHHIDKADFHAVRAADKNMDPKQRKFHEKAAAGHTELAKAHGQMSDMYMNDMLCAHKECRKGKK